MTGSVKSWRASAFFAFMATVAVVAIALIGTNTASADSIQVQSYQRVSQAEACAAQLGETPWQASWGADPSWSPSWEQWANNGTGGWVCTRSITWARTTVAGESTPRTYSLGDIGPGGGLVFLISDGKTYEMAKAAWSVSGEGRNWQWCSNNSSGIAGALGTAVGTGSANTTAMLEFPCTSGAAFGADAYSGGGFTDWFLPSLGELNAMCNYSRTWVGSPSTGTCTGSQNADFAAGDYGFANTDSWYWSSTGGPFDNYAQYLKFEDSGQSYDEKDSYFRVRPVRAF